MKTPGERLAYFIDSKSDTRKEWCDKNGLEKNNISGMITGQRAIGLKVLNTLHEKEPNLNMHWLLYGEGTMLLDQQEFLVLNEVKATYETTDPMEVVFLNLLKKPSIQIKIQELQATALQKMQSEIVEILKLMQQNQTDKAAEALLKLSKEIETNN